MRDLLDARSAAQADHGLDMRTELRPGDVAEELQKELAAYDNSMLVLGTSNPAAIRWDWLKGLLEDSPQRAVLIVNSARSEATPDG
jgi:nucleotide-binding universal stress UspA family protein